MADSNARTGALDTDDIHRRYLEERDKRLRKDADAQYVDASGDYADLASDPYVVEPLKRDAVEEEIDVAVIGGGFGGLLTGAKLRDAGVDDFRIFDQAADFGGTWYWNRYPGVRCDIEAYVYMPLLEEVGTMPSERYATGAEIFAHCQKIGEKYDLYERAYFQTKVTDIRWLEERRRWLIRTDRGDKVYARFVTASQGPLAKVKLPGIPGIREFSGPLFHSSRWRYDYTGGSPEDPKMTKLADQRVAVIGTGATAVQIVPRLADHAKEVLVFQRTPSAVAERNNRPTDREWFESQPAGWQRQRMDSFLSVISGQPGARDVVQDCWTDFFMRVGKRMNERHQEAPNVDPHEVMQEVDYVKMAEIRDHVDRTIADAATAENAKPWYNYLCKRPLYSDDYLQSFNRENVRLIDTEGQGVTEITAAGLVASGEHYDVDAIIFATGFDVGAPPQKVGGYELVGRDGVNLDEKWAEGVTSVHGTQVSGFPNLHIVGGTAQGTTAFNFTHALDIQADHAVALISRCLNEGVSAMEVTPDAERRWADMMERHHIDRTHFYEECTPGFLNNEGDFRDRPTFISATFGAGPIEYQRVIAEWRDKGYQADTDIRYEKDAAEAA